MEQADRLNKIIHKLVNSTSEKVTKEAYKEWAESYDGDLESFGYVAPQIGTTFFHRALNMPTGLIFDAGCGTGRVGQLLADIGYGRLHGADFSPEMLGKAADLNIYQTLSQLNFREPLPLPTAHYDGAISIGVYSSFIGELFLQELIRIVKVGGIITMSARPVHFDNSLRLQIEHSVQMEQITLLDHQLRPYMTGQGAEANYLVLQKN